MKRYEYIQKYVLFDDIIEFKPGGKLFPIHKEIINPDFLSNLGNDGWELISVLPVQEASEQAITTGFLYVFKREVQI